MVNDAASGASNSGFTLPLRHWLQWIASEQKAPQAKDRQHF
jgi:hypothetical protein